MILDGGPPKSHHSDDAADGILVPAFGLRVGGDGGQGQLDAANKVLVVADGEPLGDIQALGLLCDDKVRANHPDTLGLEGCGLGLTA